MKKILREKWRNEEIEETNTKFEKCLIGAIDGKIRGRCRNIIKLGVVY